MSRIPPFMRPAKVRDLLAPYGEVGRIYLKPEGILCATCCTASHRFLDVALCRFRTASHDRAHALLLSRTVCVSLSADQSSAYRRKKRGGNKKKKYTEGWVEFADKEVAESVRRISRS